MTWRGTEEKATRHHQLGSLAFEVVPFSLAISWPTASVRTAHRTLLVVTYNEQHGDTKTRSGSDFTTCSTCQSGCDASMTHEVTRTATCANVHTVCGIRTAHIHIQQEEGARSALWMTVCLAVFESRTRAMSEAHSFIIIVTVRDMFVAFKKFVV